MSKVAFTPISMKELIIDFITSLDGYGTAEGWLGWGGTTHHPQVPITMEGGTTFHFVTDSMHAALQRATAAANGEDIRLSGGVATIRQYLQAGLIDQLHLAIAPILLGSGEHLLAGIDLLQIGYALTEHVQTAKATHLVLTKEK